MTDKQCKILRIVIAIVCTIAVIFFFFGVATSIPPTQPDRYAPWGKKEYDRLLKKHGLKGNAAVLGTDWNGVTYFERDGKWLRFQ